MIKAPCKDCVDREPSCHSSCEKYISWKKEFDEQKATIVKARIAESQANGRRRDAITKMMKIYK